MNIMSIEQHPEHYQQLQQAVQLLESPSLAIKISNTIGSPVEQMVHKLPASVQNKIHGLVESALMKASEVALWSLNKPGLQSRFSGNGRHKIAAALSGATGGALGMVALSVELPVSTTIMLRSIADTARTEGFDLNDVTIRQECLQVFALGGNRTDDDAAESGYYMTRAFLAETMQHLSRELAQLAAHQAGSSLSQASSHQVSQWMVRLVEKIAARFGIVITEKFAAQAVPVIGAVAGASINTLFISHYQNMARGHFIVKRLEQQYSEAQIKNAYTHLCSQR